MPFILVYPASGVPSLGSEDLSALSQHTNHVHSGSGSTKQTHPNVLELMVTSFAKVLLLYFVINVFPLCFPPVSFVTQRNVWTPPKPHSFDLQRKNKGFSRFCPKKPTTQKNIENAKKIGIANMTFFSQRIKAAESTVRFLLSPTSYLITFRVFRKIHLRTALYWLLES